MNDSQAYAITVEINPHLESFTVVFEKTFSIDDYAKDGGPEVV